MTAYAGFDVSDKMTTICVVDAEGTILKRDAAPSDPDEFRNSGNSGDGNSGDSIINSRHRRLPLASARAWPGAGSSLMGRL